MRARSRTVAQVGVASCIVGMIAAVFLVGRALTQEVVALRGRSHASVEGIAHAEGQSSASHSSLSCQPIYGGLWSSVGAQQINGPGLFCLTDDLIWSGSASTDYPVTFTSSAIGATFDLNGYSITCPDGTCDGWGIRLAGGRDILIENGTIHGFGDGDSLDNAGAIANGIFTGDGATFVTIRDLVLSNNRAGVGLGNNADNTDIVDNTFLDSAFVDIESVTSGRYTIRNNVFMSPSVTMGANVELQYASDALVTNNQFHGAPGSGVLAVDCGSSSTVKMRNNVIEPQGDTDGGVSLGFSSNCSDQGGNF